MSSRSYEQFRVVDDMNDFRSWDEATKYSEQIKAIIDLKAYGLGALGSTFYEQLRVVVNMNDSKSWA